MNTDFYLTNASASGKTEHIVFFQKIRPSKKSGVTQFSMIKNCPYRWGHKIKVCWDLSFRLVTRSGVMTSVHFLKTIYTLQKKRYLISKDGIIMVQQSYKSGNQVIDFDQIKGNEFVAVQLYRGDILIEEAYFQGQYLHFEVGTIIRIGFDVPKSTVNNSVTKHPRTILDIDLVGLKSIYLTICGDSSKGNMIIIDTILKW